MNVKKLLVDTFGSIECESWDKIFCSQIFVSETFIEARAKGIDWNKLKRELRESADVVKQARQQNPLKFQHVEYQMWARVFLTVADSVSERRGYLEFYPSLV